MSHTFTQPMSESLTLSESKPIVSHTLTLPEFESLTLPKFESLNILTSSKSTSHIEKGRPIKYDLSTIGVFKQKDANYSI